MAVSCVRRREPLRRVGRERRPDQGKVALEIGIFNLPFVNLRGLIRAADRLMRRDASAASHRR